MKVFIVDSFTREKFTGNPAGVFLLERKIKAKQMLSIAQELNLSETAFLEQLESKYAYAIRYFSPKMEIPLCGHATLASAKILFEYEGLESVIFTTIQGIDLSVIKKGEHMQMEFPVYETQPAKVPQSMLAALGLSAVKHVVYNEETRILLLEIEDTDLLRNLRPDFAALYKSHDTINGVLVTAPDKDGVYDFHSRYFWPWSGTNEDPVTGGTHTFLAKYWGDRLGKSVMKSFQSSARTGSMEVELTENNKLLIRGEAVCVLAGELML